jgi:hypothetical protein
MPLFGAFKNIAQTASLGETHFSLIACLHVCLYFLPLFTRKIGSAERERRKNLVGEDMPSKMEEESSCCPFSPSSLWEVIVKCDDICFTHVLPRLNRTDLKFLDRVNTETRKLVKRSSRKKELKERFKVREMSSISTLEFAWENKSLWTIWWRETWFCDQVARTNKLELLKWIREEKKCKWDEDTIEAAASQGNLEMVKYCVANKCPINMWSCAWAAQNGHLEVLKYLREEAKAPWDWRTAARAAQNGHLHILEYLVERKYDKYNELACRNAAENGHLDCLKYLHETAKAPWDSRAVREAHENKHPECLQYLLDNNCPLPSGWSYENGELHIS